MVLEMKRALEDLKKGDPEGYRKMYDAVYEETCCRSFLIIRQEDQVKSFLTEFFRELFTTLETAEPPVNQERWFWQQYYRKLRKQYHKLMAALPKTPELPAERTLADVPASLPLLHRIMLVMHFQDDFSVVEIAETFGIAEDKIRAELGKLTKALPALAKGQPKASEAYLSNWKLLLTGAFRQITAVVPDEWADQIYEEAAKAAGIATEKKEDTFEYFIADPVVDEPQKTPQKEEETEVPDDEEEDEEDAGDEEDGDEDEYGDDDEEEDDEDDEEEDDEDEDEDDEDDEDDRYDWDLEDDGRKMVVLGVILALIIVVILGFAAVKLLGGDESGSLETEETSETQEEAELIIKGDLEDEEDDASEEESSETETEETSEETEEETEEEQTTVMNVNASSVNVRSEASTDSEVVTQVNSGEQVEALSDTSEEWVQIRCIEQNSEEGYVKSEFLTAAE